MSSLAGLEPQVDDVSMRWKTFAGDMMQTQASFIILLITLFSFPKKEVSVLYSSTMTWFRVKKVLYYLFCTQYKSELKIDKRNVKCLQNDIQMSWEETGIVDKSHVQLAYLDRLKSWQE